MPSLDILKLYKDCGGEIITLGSDSHVVDTLAVEFPLAIAHLKEAGFKYICTFTDGKPEFHYIDNL